jgi:hypothetical protein
MAILLRLAMWGLAAVCCVSVASSMNRAADVATSTFSPFGFLAAGILVAAIGYSVAQLRRR